MSSLLKYLIAILAATTIFSGQVLAVEETAKAGPASIDQSILELGQAKDDENLSAEERLNKEIDARNKIIEEVITLSLKEIDSLKEKLGGLPKFADKSREKELHTAFNEELKGHSVYYENQKQRLEELNKERDRVNLNEELKNLAKAIKDYRETAYNPWAQKVIEFTLVFYNENVVVIAKVRLSKINSDIKKLERLGLIEKSIFRGQLDKAARLISTASDLQVQAKNTLLTPEEPPQKELEEESKLEKAPTKPKPTARELSEKSLSSLKAAYDIFLKVGKETRRALKID